MGLCLDRSPLHRIGGLSHRGDTLAQAILTVAPSLSIGGLWAGPPWFYEPIRTKTLRKTKHKVELQYIDKRPPAIAIFAMHRARDRQLRLSEGRGSTAVSDSTRSLTVISDVSDPDPPHPSGNHEPFRTRKDALRRAVSAKRPRDTSRAVCYSELVDWLQRGLAGRAPSAIA